MPEGATHKHLGNEGWDYGSVLPYFKKSEHNERGESHYHGAKGPLWISDNPDPSNKVVSNLLESVKQLGYKADASWDLNGA